MTKNTNTPPAQDRQPQPMRLRSPEQMLTALPYLVGHHPSNACVVLCLDDSDRVVLTMNVGAPEPSNAPPSAADCVILLRAALSRLPATATAKIVLTVFADQRPRPGDSAAPLIPSTMDQEWVAQLRRCTDDADIDLLDVLVVRAGRWASALCRERSCCPIEGNVLPAAHDAADVTAEFVGRGVAPLRDRAEVAALLSPDPDHDRRAAVGADLAVLERQYPCTVNGARRLFERAWRIAEGALQPARPAPAHDPVVVLPARDVAILVLAMSRRGVRDALLARSATKVRDGLLAWPAILEPLRCALRDAPEGYVAGIASAVALVSWQCGGGAQASIALQRCLADDPGHRFGTLLSMLVTSAVPPWKWAESIAGLDEERCLRFLAA